MFSPGPIRSAVLVSATLLAALTPGTPAHAQTSPARFFLSWNAPYGHPAAAEHRNVACGDSSRRDTLYVSFDPGRDSTQLIAVDAEIRIFPAAGDTLDRHWWLESRSNPAHLIADFNLPDTPGALPMWSAPGAGGVRTVSGPDTAFVRMVWAVREQDASVVRGRKIYGFARLIVPRPARAEVCAKPLCLELAYGRLAYDIRNTEVVRGGKRWVSWNAGATAPCAEQVRQARIQPWRMPAKKR